MQAETDAEAFDPALAGGRGGFPAHGWSLVAKCMIRMTC